MQTFLPYANFKKSAEVLDRQRLGKQRVECLQILNALTGKTKGWVNHPVTKMWRGYEQALIHYGIAICTEWKSRGYKDTCQEKIEAMLPVETDYKLPSFIGKYSFHQAMQSNLVRKNPEHYRNFFPDVADNIEYVYE